MPHALKRSIVDTPRTTLYVSRLMPFRAHGTSLFERHDGQRLTTPRVLCRESGGHDNAGDTGGPTFLTLCKTTHIYRTHVVDDESRRRSIWGLYPGRRRRDAHTRAGGRTHALLWAKTREIVKICLACKVETQSQRLTSRDMTASRLVRRPTKYINERALGAGASG